MITINTEKLADKIKGLKFNSIIRILTYSDSLLWGGYTMLNATAAIYLKEHINTKPLEAISFGFAVYTITRSLVQLPIAKFLDKHPKYTDEAYAIAISCLIMASGIFSYQFVSEPWHLYMAQFIFGIGAALNMPAWRKTFAKFVDKNHEGLQYSIYDAITNLSVAALTSIGGFILAQTGNFRLLITIASLIIATGGFVALRLTKETAMTNSSKVEA